MRHAAPQMRVRCASLTLKPNACTSRHARHTVSAYACNSVPRSHAQDDAPCTTRAPQHYIDIAHARRQRMPRIARVSRGRCAAFSTTPTTSTTSPRPSCPSSTCTTITKPFIAGAQDAHCGRRSSRQRVMGCSYASGRACGDGDMSRVGFGVGSGFSEYLFFFGASTKGILQQCSVGVLALGLG